MPRPSASRAAVLGAVLMLMVAGALWRCWGLREWSLSGDEAAHALIASKPTLWRALVASFRLDAHPPLYYLILHGTIRAGLDRAPWMLRVPALAAGILTIPAFYWLGSLAAGGRAGGLVLAWLAAFSDTLAWHSQVVRHYAVQVLIAALLLRFFLARRWAGYFLCAFLIGQLDFAPLFLIAVLGALELPRLLRRPIAVRRLALWSLAHAALLAVAVVEFRLQEQLPLRLSATFLDSAMTRSPGETAREVGAALSSMHLGRFAAGNAWLLLPFTAGCALLWRERRFSLVAVALAPLALAALLSFLAVYPLAGPSRFRLWLVPATLLPVAVACQRLVDAWRGWGRMAAATALVALFAGYLALTHPLDPDALRYRDDYGARIAEVDEAYRVARRQAGPAPVLISYTFDQLDQLARRLGWSALVFPPPARTTTAYEITVPGLKSALLGQPAAWVLVRDQDDFVPRLAATRCLAGARAIAVPPYQLLSLDGPATQQLLSTPGCEQAL